MKLYDAPFAPNARRVRMFLAEKGLVVPSETVDLGKLQHKAPAYSAINPLQRVPALELDSGEVLCESVAICRYFEEIQPEPPLFGTSPLQKAQIEMWQRRAELNFLFPAMMAFRHSHPAMAELEKPQIPEYAVVSRARAIDFTRFLDAELAQRPFMAGEDFSIADITAFIACEFTKPGRVSIPEDLIHLGRWRAKIAERPSAAA